jgi:hypothetical protein
MTVTLLLLIIALIFAVLALFVRFDRVNLTAIGLLIVIVALLLGSVHP